MQLIKPANQNSENRSQEISKITRELKTLGKEARTPIILLSQLNRNIESRVNKRPLLSDLRESGCLSYANTPRINKIFKNIYASTEIVYCSKQFYKSNQETSIELKSNKKQYLYLITGYKKLSLCITHNHKILTSKKWKKGDQIKEKCFQGTRSDNHSSLKITIEIGQFKQIKMLKKEKVYDIALYEYSNFSIDKIIIHNSIEQDADLILMLYRNSEKTDDRKIDIVIAKHRNGPTGSFELIFHADVCKFSSIKSSNTMEAY